MMVSHNPGIRGPATLIEPAVDDPRGGTVLYVVNVSWFFISHRLSIAKAAVRRGFTVYFAGKVCSPSDRKTLEDAGIRTIDLETGRGSLNPLSDLKFLFELGRILYRVKPDVLHLVTIKPVIYGGLAARILRQNAVLSAIPGLGTLFARRPKKSIQALRWLILPLYRLALRHPNQTVVFQNPDDEEALIRAGAVMPDRCIRIAGSGVDLSEYTVRPEPVGQKIVTMACRLLREKGVYEFVSAARALKSEGVEAKFQLVGSPDPDNPTSIEASTIEEWRREGVVECLGFQQDMPQVIAGSNIVVLPSYYGEGLPKVLVEAAACGRAIVTTDMPGCRDAIVPNVSGLLVAPQNATDLAAAVRMLLECDDVRSQMGAAGRRLAIERFDLEKIVDQHLQVYDKLLNAV